MADLKSRAAFLLNLSGAKRCQKTKPTQFLPRETSSCPSPEVGWEHSERHSAARLSLSVLTVVELPPLLLPPDCSVHLHPTPNEEIGGISSSLSSSKECHKTSPRAPLPPRGPREKRVLLANWQGRAPWQENSAALHTRRGAAPPTRRRLRVLPNHWLLLAWLRPFHSPGHGQSLTGCRHSGRTFGVWGRTHANTQPLRSLCGRTRSLTPCLVCLSGF